MKKHLIAAAVAAAVAAPAMAQVSLDGYWEGNYGSIKKSGGVATTKTTSMNGLSDVFGGSEINFRGTEDLGGGLKAGFRLTKEFSEATGAGVNASEWTNAFLTVETGMGSIAAGRFISGARDLGGVYRFNGDFGRVNAFVNTAGNRPAQQIQYTSPAFMGFNLVLGSAKAETDGSDSAVSESLAMIRYVAGPLRVAASSNKVKGRPADTGSATAVGRASNANQKETAVGGSYDFGVAKLGLAYFKDDLAAANGVSAQKSDGKATTVQLEAPLSGGVTLMAGYNKYQSDIAQADGSGIAVGVKYALSKRTNLFAVHNKDKNEANANWNFRAYGADTGGDLANGEDLSRTVFGINHSF